MGCNKSNSKDIKTQVKQNKSFQIPQEKQKQNTKHKTQKHTKHKTNYAREEENSKQFQEGGGGADEDQ
jgi:hypothetical protein